MFLLLKLKEGTESSMPPLSCSVLPSSRKSTPKAKSIMVTDLKGLFCWITCLQAATRANEAGSNQSVSASVPKIIGPQIVQWTYLAPLVLHAAASLCNAGFFT